MKNQIKMRPDVALLITRLIVGGIFVYSGWLKVFDMAGTVAMFDQIGIMAPLTYIVSYGELIAGLMLMLGLWTEFAALFLTIVMLVAFYLTRNFGFEVFGLPLATLSGVLVILGCGPGKYKMKEMCGGHYICRGGCKGVSKVPGACQAPSCAHHNHKLVKCGCGDGLHNNLI